MLNFWVFFLSCAVMTYSVYIETGPAAGGWTVYPPLIALPQAMPGSGLWYDAVVGEYGILYYPVVAEDY